MQIYNKHMISGLLLSAGLSSRFGSPKALACIDSSPAIIFLIEKLLRTSLDEIIVVLGADNQQIEPCLFKHKTIRVVYNKDYNFGQTSTVQTGLKSASAGSLGFMILPVDCPFIKAQTVEAVIQRFTTEHPRILIPTFQDHRGHPPVFDIRFKESILKLDPSQGVDTLLHMHPEEIATIELDDPGIRQSFNTPEELAEIKKSMGIT
jgi:molybdenum cofactor cytidylyltransferase